MWKCDLTQFRPDDKLLKPWCRVGGEGFGLPPQRVTSIGQPIAVSTIAKTPATDRAWGDDTYNHLNDVTKRFCAADAARRRLNTDTVSQSCGMRAAKPTWCYVRSYS